MDTNERSSPSLLTLRTLALPTLIIVFGMQTMRVFLPSIAWYLKDTVDAGTVTLAIYAFIPFLTAFLANIIRRLLRPRFALWLTAGGVTLLRLVEQFSRLPILDLWLSLIGTGLFLLFLPTYLGHTRSTAASSAAPRWAYGLILGLALDSFIRGASGTLDLSWISGLIPIIILAFMAGAVLLLLWLEQYSRLDEVSDGTWGSTLPLLALGPFILVQALIFQNQGWIAEVGGISSSLAFFMLMLGNLLAVFGVTWGFTRSSDQKLVLALVVTVYLGYVVANADQPGILFLIQMLVAQLVMGWGWATLSRGLATTSRTGLGRTTLVLGLSMLLFLLMAFLYYISLDIAVPIPRTTLPPAAAILFGLILLFTTLRWKDFDLVAWGSRSALFTAGVMGLLALLYWIVIVIRPGPASKVAPKLPARVMTYNIHSAYASDGRQDPEAIAQVIESNSADIIALQEVSRGWLIDGSTDLVAWLARRLGMQVLFKGTADPVWGNAILTRYPILEHGTGTLPLVDTRIGRGYLWVTLEVGAQKPLTIIATHLHHEPEEGYVRLEQVPVLLSFWDDEPFSVILGDMNAWPGEPEMDMFEEAGLIDSWVEAGSGEGLTFSAVDPYQRIDWIFHTADLRAIQAQVIRTPASDHLPVIILLDGAE